MDLIDPCAFLSQCILIYCKCEYKTTLIFVEKFRRFVVTICLSRFSDLLTALPHKKKTYVH